MSFYTVAGDLFQRRLDGPVCEFVDVEWPLARGVAMLRSCRSGIGGSRRFFIMVVGSGKYAQRSDATRRESAASCLGKFTLPASRRLNAPIS
jgi:hypothetical protein